MGRVRTQTAPRQTRRLRQSSSEASAEDPAPLEGEIALTIALILAGGVVLPPSTTPLAAIAALLLLLPDVSGAESPVADTAARLVARGIPRLSEGSGALRTAQMSNLSHRAHYAINAAKRLAQDVVGGENLQGALAKESRHFANHREAERRRLGAARMVDAAVELHGPILGWRHGNPKEPRPSHARADGMNFDAGRIPRSTGALPGVLPNCTCTVTAPFENGRVLR